MIDQGKVLERPENIGKEDTSKALEMSKKEDQAPLRVTASLARDVPVPLPRQDGETGQSS